MPWMQKHTERKKQWTFPVWSELCLSIFAQLKMQGGRRHIKQWFIHSHLYKQLTSTMYQQEKFIFFTRGELHIQYTYIGGKYKIYLYEL